MARTWYHPNGALSISASASLRRSLTSATWALMARRVSYFSRRRMVYEQGGGGEIEAAYKSLWKLWKAELPPAVLLAATSLAESSAGCSGRPLSSRVAMIVVKPWQGFFPE
jgi:hypothetical protein